MSFENLSLRPESDSRNRIAFIVQVKKTIRDNSQIAAVCLFV